MPMSRVVQQVLGLVRWTPRIWSLYREAAYREAANGCGRGVNEAQDRSCRTLDVEDMLRLDPHLLRDIGVCRCALVHRAMTGHWGYAGSEAATPRRSGDNDPGPTTSARAQVSIPGYRLETARFDPARPG